MTALYSSVLAADSQYFDLVDCSALYGVTKLRVTVDRGSARVYCGARPDALVELQDCSVGVTDIRLPMLPYVGVARLSGNSSSIKIEVLGPEASELPLTSEYLVSGDWILNGATAGQDSGWVPYFPGMRLAYALDSGTTSTTFSVDISADGSASLGQAFTGTWASSTAYEISPPIWLNNQSARFIRFNVLTGGPLSVKSNA